MEKYIIYWVILYFIIGLIIVRVFSRRTISYDKRINGAGEAIIVFLAWPVILVFSIIWFIFEKLIE